ncbi:thioredoxin family protein [Tabrizicola sp.]|uniref:thioredoxin family protein n=1 Tax=Tabrizicola sp. TaxID=2005166 RepID=UPI002623BAD6|nr:thioredoxin family protein [Tabrizicola sp.]MDM7932197.1 thioredoxin family protein [Tabrizicola sp.]
MNRRAFLGTSCAALILPLPALAADRVFYTPGLAEKALDAGKVVFLDFWTNWCSTCAAQDRVITDLRRANPGYDKMITFITVDWDQHADSDLARNLGIPRRSTLVVLKGDQEIGRIVAGTSKADIKALMDAALAAAQA